MSIGLTRGVGLLSVWPLKRGSSVHQNFQEKQFLHFATNICEYVSLIVLLL